MQRNRTLFQVGLSLLILSLVIAITLVSYMRLDEPVFLYNFKESNILSQEGYYNKRNFDFSYITNLGDNRYVTAISFPDSEAIEVSVIDPAYYLATGAQYRYGPYVMRNVNVTVSDVDVTTTFDPLELKTGTVTLSNGETLEVDFGRVLITNHGLNFPSVQFVSSTSSGSSDQAHQNISTFRATEDLFLLGVESPLFQDLGDMLSIEVNGVSVEDIERMVFRKGDLITVTTSIAPTEQLNSTYTAYEVQPLVTWEDGSGELHTQILNNINYQPYRFQLSGIVKYLKERGVL